MLAAWADEDLIRQAIAAAPDVALTERPLAHGYPLHAAVHHSNLGAVRALLEAAPAVAGWEAMYSGLFPRLPLDTCLHCIGPTTIGVGNSVMGECPCFNHARLEMARVLLLATPTEPALAALRTSAVAVSRLLFPHLAASRPLTPAQWAHVPCLGLGAVLRAVLARSPTEAAALAARLPEEERQRLRCAALCLGRAQRQRGAELPAPLVGRIVGLAMARQPYVGWVGLFVYLCACCSNVPTGEPLQRAY